MSVNPQGSGRSCLSERLEWLTTPFRTTPCVRGESPNGAHARQEQSLGTQLGIREALRPEVFAPQRFHRIIVEGFNLILGALRAVGSLLAADQPSEQPRSP